MIAPPSPVGDAGRVGGPDGKIAIKAGAVFVVVPVEHFTEHGKLDHARRDFEVNP